MKTFAPSPDSAATELIEAHLNDSLTEEQGQELARRLKSDPQFRAYYIDSMGLDAAMQREFEYFTDTALIEPINDSSKLTSHKRNWLPWALTGTAAVAAILIALKFNTPDAVELTSGTTDQTTPEESIEKPVRRSIARLISSENAVWSGKRKNLPVGSWLKPGVYQLQGGNASVEFDSGATFQLTNKAKIELRSDNRGKIFMGEVVANVPAYNSDFQVELPNGIVTEEAQDFAVRIHKDKSMDFQVIAGSATLKRKNQVIKTIISNKEAVRFDKKGKASITQCFAQEKRSPKRKFVTRDYVHYRFDSVGPDGLVTDQGTHSEKMNGQLLDTSIKKSIRPGVYGNAVFFNGTGAHMQTSYKGVGGNKPRTVAFWVKIPEGVHTQYSYSMAAWGKASKGNKWQICWNTGRESKKNRGAIRTEFGHGRAIATKDLRDGQWHHIAIVYLGGPTKELEKNIKFYVDGKIDPISASQRQPINTDTKLSSFTVGSRLENKGSGKLHKGFKGWIDEMYVFEAALAPFQVRQLYKNNIAPARDRFIPSVVGQ